MDIRPDFSPERMARALQASKAEAATRPAIRASCGKEGFFLERKFPTHCIHRAMASEGPDVMSLDGECYWKDMEKLYPHIRVKREPSNRFSMAERSQGSVVSGKLTERARCARGGKLAEILSSGRSPEIPKSKCQQ